MHTLVPMCLVYDIQICLCAPWLCEKFVGVAIYVSSFSFQCYSIMEHMM